MSYSRWSNSRWYTFWCCSGSKKRADQLFDVDCSVQFTYADLKNDLEACMAKVRRYEQKKIKADKRGTPEEHEELRGYMRQFMADVEKDAGLQD